MNVLINFFIVILINPATSSMIINILERKNVKDAVVINCDSNYEKINLQNEFSDINGRSHYINIKPNVTDDIRQYFNKIAIIVYTSCENWREIFSSPDEETTRMFKSPFIWFILTQNFTTTVEHLSQYPIEVDSDVSIIHDNGEKMDIHEIYNTGFFTNGTFQIRKKGYWSKANLVMKEKKRSDFSGVMLKCMTVVTNNIINESLTHYMEMTKEVYGTDTLNKLKFFILLKYLRDMYHFSFEIKRTKSWGYIRNGSFDGMVGALQRREVDIGCSPIFFWSERARVIDYTIQTWQARQTFILRHPKRVGAFYTIFTHPLSSTVWYSSIGVLSLSALFLCVLLKFKAIKLPEDEQDSSVGIALLSIWSAFCQQGMFVNRSSTTINLVIFSTFLFTLTVYQYYNASVVSSLLRESPKNIRTLEDLMRSNLKAGIENYPYNMDYFKRTTSPVAIRLYNEKIITKEGRNIFDTQRGMSLVKHGGFAFHVDSSSGYYYMRRYFEEKEICEIQEIQLFPPMVMVNAVKKGSPYRETITRGLRRMYEVGILHRIKSVWDEARPDCVRTPDTSAISVSIVEASAPFIALSGGFVISVAILCAELCFYKIKKKRQVVSFRH